MERNNEYWKRRAISREAESKQEGKGLAEEIFAEYEKAVKDINDKIYGFYGKYGGKYGMNMEQAMKTINKEEYREWRKSLEEYVAEIEREVNEETARRLRAELDARSYNSQITRLNALKEQIGASIDSLSAKYQAKMTDGLKGIFEEAMAKKAFDMFEKGFKPTMEFREKVFDENLVKEVLKYPWSGADYSERIWKNTSNLAYTIKEELAQGLIKGTSCPQMAKRVAERMGQSFKVSERLIETETSRIHGEAHFKVYEAADIEEYEFVAEKELTTCSVCGSLDGQHFKITERQVGVNCHPMHPNCHCVTIEYDPEEEQDYINSGLEYKKRQTYTEWWEEQKKQYGEERMNNEHKKVHNKATDKEQYDRYRDILGKENMPKSLAEFQEMKYNKKEEWNLFKDYSNSVKSGELTPLADFELYKRVNQEIDEKLIGITTANGIEIKNKSKHFIARVIGSIEDKRSGVPVDTVLDTLKNPSVIKPVRFSENGPSQKFVSNDVCIVSVNPEDNKLIQVNPYKVKRKGS